MTNNKNTTLSKNEIFVNEIVFYNRDNISLLGFVQQGKKYAEAEYIISRAHLYTLLLANGKSGREVKRHIEQLFATPHQVPATINLIDMMGTTQALEAKEITLSKAENNANLLYVKAVDSAATTRKFFY
ncbi:MAG: hypothetical protein JST49_13665 [Bacteroidetes bacterium]|nr:hypothetical protein [Bacteroidota bacterium]